MNEPYSTHVDNGHEKIRRRDRIAPQLAIMAIGVFATVFDVLCKKGCTISEEVDRLRESPVTGKYTHLALEALYHHFKRDVPPEDDPIHRIATYIGKD